LAAGLLLLQSRTNLAVDDRDAFTRAESSLPSRITGGTCRRLTRARTILAVWSHNRSRCAGLLEDERTGNWIALVGNPARADLRTLDGDRLLARLLAEFREQGADFVRSLSPPFALLLGHGATGEVEALVDRCGLQHLYFGGREHTWLSSSSMALAPVLGAEPDRTGIAEWVTVGHFLSNRTFVRGVLKLSAGERLLLCPGRDAETRRESPTSPADSSARDARPTYREAFEASLHASGSDHGLSNELTGGLDSRLILAGLLHAGERSLSWTFGDPGCPDIRTVKRLKRRVPFAHLVVPVDASLADGIVNHLQEMHVVSDGEVNALEYAPLLSAFRRLDGRRTASLSGAGGEIGRGFYYHALRSAAPRVRGIPLDGLVARMTADAGVLASLCREEVVPDRHAPAARVLEKMIDASPVGTPEAILDDIYLRARMQRFAGRNFTTTGLFCRQGLPYFGNELVDVVNALPPPAKQDGRIMRQTLFELSPALASVPLDSGMSVRLDEPQRAGVLPKRGDRGSAGLRTTVRAAVGQSSPPQTVPWGAVLEHRAFGTYVRDLLCSSSAYVNEFFPRDRLEAFVDASIAGGLRYPLGLLITLELTYRRLSAFRTSQPLVQ
jgi:asparagine synthase (glutamine-hydrolysing)